MFESLANFIIQKIDNVKRMRKIKKIALGTGFIEYYDNHDKKHCYLIDGVKSKEF